MKVILNVVFHEVSGDLQVTMRPSDTKKIFEVIFSDDDIWGRINDISEEYGLSIEVVSISASKGDK